MEQKKQRIDVPIVEGLSVDVEARELTWREHIELCGAMERARDGVFRQCIRRAIDTVGPQEFEAARSKVEARFREKSPNGAFTPFGVQLQAALDCGFFPNLAHDPEWYGAAYKLCQVALGEYVAAKMEKCRTPAGYTSAFAFGVVPYIVPVAQKLVEVNSLGPDEKKA